MILRRTPLRRSAKRLRARRPVPADEQAAEEAARLTVWARASNPWGPAWCEVCGLESAREYQHRKARAHCSKDELWDPRNGLVVCGHGNVSGCHGYIHQNPELAYANGWSVRSGLDPAKQPCRRRNTLVWFMHNGEVVPLTPGEIEEWEKAA